MKKKKHHEFVKNLIFESVNSGCIHDACRAVKTVEKDKQKYISFNSNLTSTTYTADFFFQMGFTKEAKLVSDFVFKKSQKTKSIEMCGKMLKICRENNYKLNYEPSDFFLNVYHWLITKNFNFYKEYFEMSTLLRFDDFIEKKKFYDAAEILSCYSNDKEFRQICENNLDPSVLTQIQNFLL